MAESTGFPKDIAYPFGYPSVSGTTITADFLASNPRMITRAIADLTLKRFYLDQIFGGGGASTPSVIYEQRTENAPLYAGRDVEAVEPGSEFPLVTFERGAPKTAQAEKFGGKFFITDEARRRNDVNGVNQAIQLLANTIQRKTQQRALAEMDAAITGFSRTAAGTSWQTAAGTVEASRVPTTGPLADLTSIELANETQELGYTYDFAIMNPNTWRYLRLAAGGTSQAARALLADSGITGVWVTNQQPTGQIKWLARKMLGELSYEVPLSTETWRDSDGKQQDWFQSYVLPIVFITDPYAILVTTGHNT